MQHSYQETSHSKSLSLEPDSIKLPESSCEYSSQVKLEPLSIENLTLDLERGQKDYLESESGRSEANTTDSNMTGERNNEANYQIRFLNEQLEKDKILNSGVVAIFVFFCFLELKGTIF